MGLNKNQSLCVCGFVNWPISHINANDRSFNQAIYSIQRIGHLNMGSTEFAKCEYCSMEIYSPTCRINYISIFINSRLGDTRGVFGKTWKRNRSMADCNLLIVCRIFQFCQKVLDKIKTRLTWMYDKLSRLPDNPWIPCRTFVIVAPLWKRIRSKLFIISNIR